LGDEKAAGSQQGSATTALGYGSRHGRHGDERMNDKITWGVILAPIILVALVYLFR
jgi:hypothetical protein